MSSTLFYLLPSSFSLVTYLSLSLSLSISLPLSPPPPPHLSSLFLPPTLSLFLSPFPSFSLLFLVSPSPSLLSLPFPHSPPSLSDDRLDGYQKKKYVCKLLFIFLLGNDVDFGHQEAVNLLSSTRFSEKQIVRDYTLYL